MKKFEKSVRIIHIVLCLLNVGSLFFGIMLMTGGGNDVYSFFRELSIGCCFPMLILRIAYLQYILFGLIAIFSTVSYILKIKHKEIVRKNICIDCSLWLITIFELIYLEQYFAIIISF